MGTSLLITHPYIPSPSLHQCDREGKFTKESIYWLEKQKKSSVCRGVVDPRDGSGGSYDPFGQLRHEHPFLCGTAGMGGCRAVIAFHIVLHTL